MILHGPKHYMDEIHQMRKNEMEMIKYTSSQDTGVQG
jgi:hypothetical protein